MLIQWMHRAYEGAIKGAYKRSCRASEGLIGGLEELLQSSLRLCKGLRGVPAGLIKGYKGLINGLYGAEECSSRAPKRPTRYLEELIECP